MIPQHWKLAPPAVYCATLAAIWSIKCYGYWGLWSRLMGNLIWLNYRKVKLMPGSPLPCAIQAVCIHTSRQASSIILSKKNTAPMASWVPMFHQALTCKLRPFSLGANLWKILLAGVMKKNLGWGICILHLALKRLHQSRVVTTITMRHLPKQFAVVVRRL